ncbi:MAG: 3D domain-containing protein [Phycisphaerae bacterium]|nr:3D domain-containing protein [Phycisphaerae bacterium]
MKKGTEQATAPIAGGNGVVVMRDPAWPEVIRTSLRFAAVSAAISLVVWSAILAKVAPTARPLADISLVTTQVDSTGGSEVLPDEPPITFEEPENDPEPTIVADPRSFDPTVRWFNGRPVKPAKHIWMTVTAYSPDARSCGTSDDGLTATLHAVETNGFRLVAADPTVLPYGAMVSVEGYDRGQIVPVLDCGGAIKGNRLDVLFPTHEEARAWGVRKIRVTVWKYDDGKPAENPRKVR